MGRNLGDQTHTKEKERRDCFNVKWFGDVGQLFSLNLYGFSGLKDFVFGVRYLVFGIRRRDGHISALNSDYSSFDTTPSSSNYAYSQKRSSPGKLSLFFTRGRDSRLRRELKEIGPPFVLQRCWKRHTALPKVPRNWGRKPCWDLQRGVLWNVLGNWLGRGCLQTFRWDIKS